MQPENQREPQSALSEALREFGHTSTPQELEKRGVRRLRCVSSADVARMVEKAVNRTLLERTQGVDPAEMNAMFASAQSSLLGLVRSARQIERSRGVLQEHRNDLAAQLGALREFRDQGARETETSGAPGAPGAPDAPGALGPEFTGDEERWAEAARLRAVVRAGLARVKEGASRWDLEDELVLALLAHASERRAVTRARDIVERDQHIDTLERRVRKLMQSLEETEAVLQRVAAAKDLEVGIESLYRAVQGLSPSDENSALKRQMMDLIFAANVELRSSLG